MKSKILILVITAAVITLSFSFARTNTPKKVVASSPIISNQTAPVGGFISEDKF